MKFLLVHNHYQQPGGEDQVFAAEQQLLQAHGHTVVTYTKHNDALNHMGRLAMARATLRNPDTYRELRELIRRERPQLMHCTNLFPLISPSAYAAARAERIPVVQSLHNYRFICPQAQMVRDGAVCELCLQRNFPWPAVKYACYRGNRSASAVVATLVAWQRLRHYWPHAVAKYIALTNFARAKLIAGGLPAERVTVKPNFLPIDPRPGTGQGGYAIFVGRLAPEKGLATLLEAWRQLDQRMPLWIVGDGPLADTVRQAAARQPSIRWLGTQPHDQVLQLIGDARFLLFPTHGYETFGLSIIEAYAKGTPVIASQLGSASELISHQRTGLLVPPADPTALASAVRQLWDEAPYLHRLRQAARAEFEAKYTAAQNYQQLLAIYEQALQTRR